MSKREIVIVLLVVAILAGITVPNLLRLRHRERLKRTIGDMRIIGTAAESYSIDASFYPVAISIEELRSFVEPTYIAVLPMRDAWGRPFGYVSQDGQEYTVASRGLDGLWEPARPPGEQANTDPTTAQLIEELFTGR